MDSLSSSSIARTTWELENDVVTVDSDDAIFFYDTEAQIKIQMDKAWMSDPYYFRRVKISALALLKMVVHARSSDTAEVMGIMQGKIDGHAFIIMDAFALPVEVHAPADAHDYMVEYTEANFLAGSRFEHVVGWYHSHPGYGCWLSGLDVSLQMHTQREVPFLAVVIDPKRTVSAGKVEIRAFRTFPEGYEPPDEPVSEYQTIPLDKIEDFSENRKQYYSLDITYFKSSLDSHLLDLLWNKYWVNTLSSSPMLGNADFVADQISDIADKIKDAEAQIGVSSLEPPVEGSQRKKEQESPLVNIARDSANMSVEQVHGLMSQVVKDFLFNSVGRSDPSQTDQATVEGISRLSID